VKFEDTYFSKSERYSLGTESTSGAHYLAIPVSNGLFDYEEYYRIGLDRYTTFLNSPEAAVTFAQQCRRREHDDLLWQPPGTNRGTPV